MRVVAGALCGLLACLCSSALGDKLNFKDGTTKSVRLIEVKKDVVSYVCDGKIEVVPRDKIKDDGVIREGEPLTEKELAELLKKKVKEEEAKNGVKPTKEGEVKNLIDAKDPGKGVKIIDKDKSKTGATELIIDPFPDTPVPDKKQTKTEPKK